MYSMFRKHCRQVQAKFLSNFKKSLVETSCKLKSCMVVEAGKLSEPEFTEHADSFLPVFKGIVSLNTDTDSGTFQHYHTKHHFSHVADNPLIYPYNMLLDLCCSLQGRQME